MEISFAAYPGAFLQFVVSLSQSADRVSFISAQTHGVSNLRTKNSNKTGHQSSIALYSTVERASFSVPRGRGGGGARS